MYDLTIIIYKIDTLWGNHVGLATENIFFPLKKLTDWLSESDWWKIFIQKMPRSFSMISHCYSFIFHTEPYSCWGLQSGCRLDWTHHSKAITFLLVFLAHLLHACFKSGKKHTYGLEKQRSSNFPALFLGRWWSREHDVVIGARPNPGCGHCSRPKPN